jgi:hypothetical protein
MLSTEFPRHRVEKLRGRPLLERPCGCQLDVRKKGSRRNKHSSYPAPVYCDP